jgi:hypothetical protein
MKQYLCIGGPLNGRRVFRDQLTDGYTEYNCAHGASRSVRARQRAAARGEVVPDSMIWIHDDFFRETNNGDVQRAVSQAQEPIPR